MNRTDLPLWTRTGVLLALLASACSTLGDYRDADGDAYAYDAGDCDDDRPVDEVQGVGGSSEPAHRCR